MSKLGNQTQICAYQKAKVDASILEFEKKKIKGFTTWIWTYYASRHN